MGWDTYFAFGARISESTVLEQASNLITSGLQKAGYRLIWLDVGWCRASAMGTADRGQSPPSGPRHGLARQHAPRRGFKVGLYTDAGINGCGGVNEGMYGHYQQDINTFAKWGFDAVKVDFCGGDDLHLKPSVAYGQIHKAIVNNASHRAMMLNICVFPQPGQVGKWLPELRRLGVRIVLVRTVGRDELAHRHRCRLAKRRPVELRAAQHRE